MPDNAESASFRSLFESALTEYENKTDITLAEHPLAIQLQACHSIESITALLQGQARTFSKFRGSDRVIKSIKNTLSILTTLSDTATLGDSIGLVSQKLLTACPTVPTPFVQPFSPAKAVHAGLAILLDVCPVLQYLSRYRCEIESIRQQAA
jgi:hypothetical protein